MESNTQLKICGHCKIEKPITEFSASKKMKFGVQHYCRPCSNLRSYICRTKRQKNDPLYYEKINNRSRVYRAKNPRKAYETVKKCRENNPRKEYLRRFTRLLVLLGMIEEPTCCEDCKTQMPFSKLQGHHEDYNNPYWVFWLCARCHGARHRKSLDDYVIK